MRPTIAACSYILILAIFSFAQASRAQKATASQPTAGAVQLWTSNDLSQQAKALLAQATASNGSAGATLTRLPNQYTMLTTRNRSGGAEQHSKWCDYLIVLDGEGTELTGGTIIDSHEEADGEVRGTRLEGAQSHALHKGDIIFIPAGTPHQAIQAQGQSLTLFVIKSAAPPRP
jgi:mannose-6-phosphate isomerase-like protein (cupin superfamily)